MTRILHSSSDPSDWLAVLARPEKHRTTGCFTCAMAQAPVSHLFDWPIFESGQLLTLTKLLLQRARGAVAFPAADDLAVGLQRKCSL